MRNLKIYFAEIIAVIVLVIAIMALIVFIKYGYINSNILTTNKDIIDIISSLITSIFVIIGSILSYYRFFRGKTFGVQADITIYVTLQTIDDKNSLHIIDVVFSNNGAFVILEPSAVLSAYRHGINNLSNQININWWEPPNDKLTNKSIVEIHPNEKAYFHAFTEVPQSVPTVTYHVKIRTKSGTTWSRSITVANHLENGATGSRLIKVVESH